MKISQSYLSLALLSRSSRIPSRSTFSALVSFALLSLVLFAPSKAHADVVTLKNGDHITGSVTELAGGKLTVKTTYGGDVAVAWDQVTSVKVDKPLLVIKENKAGKKIVFQKTEFTAIERTDAGFALTTTAGTSNVAAGDLTTVRSVEAEQAYEASLHPNLAHGWTGGANLSVALARGNSSTTTIGAGVNAVHPTSTDKTSLYYNTLYTRDDIVDQTTANLTNAGLRYDHNINPKLFGFGTLDFNTNALQDLDLRTIAGGGLGFHAINKPVQTLDILAGVVYTHESYSSEIDPSTGLLVPSTTNSFAALDIGETYTRKLGANSAFTEQGYYFPDLNDTSQYRGTFNAGLSTKIKSFLSWQVAFSDIYVTNPPAGLKANDVIFTTGVGFNFTKK
jgi:putative salt-induced outer membrane protein